MKPLVYIAGPITSPNPMHNVNRAIDETSALMHEGLVVPFLPHLSVLWDMVAPRHYESWLAYDYDVIRHCDAIYRLDGDSPGADLEVAFAQDLGLPLFEGPNRRVELSSWARMWSSVVVSK